MANLLSDLLNPIQQGFGNLGGALSSYLVPKAPPQPQQMQQGQKVSQYPGYVQPKAPPPDIDIQALGRFLNKAGGKLKGAVSSMMPQSQPQLLSNVSPGFRSNNPTQSPEPQVKFTMNDRLPVNTPQPQLLSQPTPIPIMAPQGLGSPVDPMIEKIAAPIFAKYGIPLSVAFGQFAQEGGGKHKYAKAPYNNPYNLGAYDRNPDGAFKYDSIEKGIEAYAKLLSGKYEMGHIGSGKYDQRYSKAYALRDNEEEMLKQIAQIGYASDPNYFKSITNTPAYKHYKGKK